jgi:hypothetical protein
MRHRIRALLWLFALALAFALLWRRVQIVFVVRVGLWPLIAVFAVLALVIYLLLDFIIDRLSR